MIITHKLQSMDLTHKQNTIRVDVVQDDKYSRDVEFTLTENGVEWQIPDGTTAVVRYKKPDGTGGNYDTLPDGSTAYQINGNVLTVALAPQVCTVPGLVQLSVGLIQGNAEINTFSVNIVVQPNPGATYQSEDYIMISGAVSNSGWAPNMYLGTDAQGNVIAKEGTSGGGYIGTEEEFTAKLEQEINTSYISEKIESKVPFLKYGRNLESGADLNSLVPASADDGISGTYYSPNSATTSSLLNCPFTGSGFTMDVSYSTGNDYKYIRQEIKSYSEGDWVRSYSNGTWAAWRKTVKTGSEEWNSLVRVEEMPTTLPNPNALTFTGAVTGSYDGSEALTVEIPSGGGAEAEHVDILSEGTLSEDVANIVADGFAKRMIALAVVPYGSTANSGTIKVMLQLGLDNGESLILNPAHNFVTNSATLSWNKIVAFAFVDADTVDVTIYRDGSSTDTDISSSSSSNFWWAKKVYTAGVGKITSVTIGLQADGVIGKNTVYKVVGA